MTDSREEHTPVLPAEVLQLLSPCPGDVVVDATVGAGGHAGLMAGRIGSEGVLCGLDVDSEALRITGEWLGNCDCRTLLYQASFAELETVLGEAGIAQVDVLLADLGVSSMQLADPQRGFSFNIDGPLDMRMDQRLEERAVDLVNRLGEQDLANLIYEYAQERLSRRIAKRICLARRDGRITTSARLAELVCQAVGAHPHARRSKIHPATRTFQALRIAVNDELTALARLLEQAPQYLKPGGRIGIISFHSLEDGMVKRDFRRRKDEGTYEIMTKRPVVAGEEEREANPRARSAKLRVARRTESEIASGE